MRLIHRRFLFVAGVACALLCSYGTANAQPGVPGAFGTFPVLSGGSYAGISFGNSQLYGGDTSGGTINTVPSGSNGLNSVASILMGTNTGPDRTVTFSWRSRAVNETYPFTDPSNPNSPLGYGEAENGLFSDVITITGMGNKPDGTGTSDAFVLQLSYSENAYIGTIHGTNPNNGDSPFTIHAPFNNAATGYPYSQLIQDQEIELWWLNPDGKGPGTPGWRPSTDGDSAIGGQAVNNYHSAFGGNAVGSFDSFKAQYGVTPSNLNNFLGANGVDDTNHVVWAVVNHNSSFAVAPEPPASVLAGSMALILGGYAFVRRNRRQILSQQA